jgi:hypothetical protein
MGTYKIAPDTTGEIGMAQMKRGLVAKADYDNSQGVTTEINMQTLVVNSTTYQGDLTSKTWNTSQPYGFGEMYGETWNDAVSYSLSIGGQSSSNCSKYTATVTRNGTLIATITKSSNSFPSSTINTTVTNGDTIVVSVTANPPTGAGSCSAYTGTDATISTANSSFSFTDRAIASSPGNASYTFTANDVNFAYIQIRGLATT